MYFDAQPETHPSASARGVSCRTNNMFKKKNGPKQPTSLVSTHGEVVKTSKSETFDPICFDPSVNIARRSPRSGPGRTTVTRPEQPICRKSSDCHSEDHINDNDNDTLREVPHQSNEGLAIQARVSGPWPLKKESVLLGKLAHWQGVHVQTVMDRV